MIISKVWKFGDNIDTDLIIPARYLNTSDENELAKHCMEDADPNFVRKMQKGDCIVGGYNFGSGSSREHAPIAIKAAGVSCVIAKSFARIFYRNAFNIGLTILELSDTDQIREGDILEIDFHTGKIHNKTTSETYQASAIPEFMQELITAGGLFNYAKRLIQKGV